MEQRAHDAQGADWNNEVFPPVRDLREVLARCGAPARDPRGVRHVDEA
jgi:hypothetical protein